MSQYRKVRLSSLPDESEKSLVNLIEKYLDKTEELEDKEEKVLKQMEMMQSAVVSLQEWNQNRASRRPSESVHVNLEEIEEETRKIKEETKRIQKEVRQKIEENKRLQDELDRRKMKERGRTGNPVRENFARAVDKMPEKAKAEAASRQANSVAPNDAEDDDSLIEDSTLEDPRIKYFNEKVKRLRSMEQTLKRESEEDSKISKTRRDKLKEKIEMLEWEAEIDRQLIQSLKKKYGQK